MLEITVSCIVMWLGRRVALELDVLSAIVSVSLCDRFSRIYKHRFTMQNHMKMSNRSSKLEDIVMKAGRPLHPGVGPTSAGHENGAMDQKDPQGVYIKDQLFRNAHIVVSGICILAIPCLFFCLTLPALRSSRRILWRISRSSRPRRLRSCS